MKNSIAKIGSVISLSIFAASFVTFSASAANLAVRPSLECVINRDGTIYTAVFGYNNLNTENVIIPVGNDNKFTPSPIDRGQTTDFLPGRQYGVFGVNFQPSSSNLVWRLKGPDNIARTSTASANSSACSQSVVDRFPYNP